MEFDDYAVAYLDILGFKEFVNLATTDASKRRKLGSLIEEVVPKQISVEGVSEFPADLEIQSNNYSDSFIVSAPINCYSKFPALVAVSVKAIQIAHALLGMRVLVRGGIAVGKVWRTSQNIVGTGYQDAVAVEERASNPQIVLHKSAECHLEELIKKGFPRYSIFAKNELGQVILDSIFPEQAYLPNAKRDISQYYRGYRETIQSNLHNLQESGRDKERLKWYWFARLFNQNIKYFGSKLGGHVEEVVLDSGPGGIVLNYLNPIDPNWMEPFQSPGKKQGADHPIDTNSAQHQALEPGGRS